MITSLTTSLTPPTMPTVALARTLMETLPRRGAYLAQSFKNSNIPVLSNIGAALINYGSNLEFTTFEKVPELAGLTVSKTPKAILILALLPFCVGGRLDAATKRAPVIPGELSANGKPKKDLRELRDILVRDVTAISVFLFGLEVLQDAVRKQYEATGRVLPFGRKNAVPRLSIFQQPSITKAASLIHYQTHLHPYQLNSPNSLLHILECPMNRSNVVGVLNNEFASYKEIVQNPSWHRLTQVISHHAEQVGLQLNGLDEQLEKGLIHSANRLKGANALPLLRRAFLNVSNMETELFKTSGTLLQHLKHNAQGLEKQLEQHLQALAHTGHSPLGALLQQLKQSGWNDEAADALEGFASNKNGALNQHLVEHLGFNKKETGLMASNGFKQAFTQHWEALKALQEVLPQWHAKQAAISLLSNENSASPITEALSKAFEQSGLVHKAVTELQEALGSTVLSKKWFNIIKIPATTLEPKNLLVKAVQTSRASGDWLALSFILGALGLAPVWLNRVLNDALYAMHLEKQKQPSALQTNTSGTTQTATVTSMVFPTKPLTPGAFTNPPQPLVLSSVQPSPVQPYSFQPYKGLQPPVFTPYTWSFNASTTRASNPFIAE